MWDGVIEWLRVPAIAVDLPGRRYRPADLGTIQRSDWVQAVVDDVKAANLDDVVLVGHSSGGYVIPGVAAALGAAAVRRLIFVAATVPAEGTRPVDFLRPGLRESTIEHEALLRTSTQGITIGGLRDGEPPIETELTIVENGPKMGHEAPGPLFEPFSWDGVPTAVPRTFIRCLNDRVVTPELVAVMVDNMGGADVIDIDAGHNVAATHPRELADLLVSSAMGTSTRTADTQRP